MTRYIVTLEKLCGCGRTVARGVVAHIDPIEFEIPKIHRPLVADLVRRALDRSPQAFVDNGDAVADCQRAYCELCQPVHVR
jgi:hypothetical protein